MSVCWFVSRINTHTQKKNLLNGFTQTMTGRRVPAQNKTTLAFVSDPHKQMDPGSWWLVSMSESNLIWINFSYKYDL